MHPAPRWTPYCELALSTVVSVDTQRHNLFVFAFHFLLFASTYFFWQQISHQDYPLLLKRSFQNVQKVLMTCLFRYNKHIGVFVDSSVQHVTTTHNNMYPLSYLEQYKHRINRWRQTIVYINNNSWSHLHISLRFFSNSEANASELLENNAKCLVGTTCIVMFNNSEVFRSSIASQRTT